MTYTFELKLFTAIIIYSVYITITDGEMVMDLGSRWLKFYYIPPFILTCDECTVKQ